MIHDDLPIKNGDFLIATLIYIYGYIYTRGAWGSPIKRWGGVGHVTVMFMLR